MKGEERRRGRQVRGSGRWSGTSRRWLLLGLISLVVVLSRWGALEASDGPNELRITSAADYSRLAPLAPESLATAFGTRLATQTAVAEGHPLPTTLGGTTVRVRGVVAALTYVSPEQVNFQIPAGLPAGEATVTVTAEDGTVAQGVTRLGPVSPGLFAADLVNKVPVGSVLWYRKGELIGEQPLAEPSRRTPVRIDPGEAGDEVYLVLQGTGIRGRGKLEDVQAIIGGITVPVVSVDDQLGEAGVDQVIVKLPETIKDPGRIEVALRIGTDGPDGVIVSNRLRIEVGTSPELEVTAPWQSLVSARRPKRETPSNALRPVRAPRITGLPLESLFANGAMSIYGSGFTPEIWGNLVKVGDEDAVVEGAATSELRVRVPFYVETGSAVEVKTSQGKVISSGVIKVRTTVSGLILGTDRKPLVDLRVELLKPDRREIVAAGATGENGVFVLRDFILRECKLANLSMVEEGYQCRIQIKGEDLVTKSGKLPHANITERIEIKQGADNHYGETTLQKISTEQGAFYEAPPRAVQPGMVSRVANVPPIKLKEGEIEFEFPAETEIGFPEGESRRVTLSRIEQSLTPVPFPVGRFSQVVAQLTPIGTTFSPGGRLVFPNEDGYEEGANLDLYRLEQREGSPNLGQFIKVGKAKVVVGVDGKKRVETEPNAIKEASIYMVLKGQPLSDPERKTTTVKGVLRGEWDRQPVRQAQVRVRGQQTLSDGNGSFLLGDVQGRAGEELTVEAIVVRADGSVARGVRTGVKVDPGGLTDLGEPLDLRIEISGTPATRLMPGLTPLNFTAASVSANGTVTRFAGRPTWQYEEDLGSGVKLEMVTIPTGSFTMGSPASEVGRNPWEGPQRVVNVNGFAMGKYEVTQAQWRAVMGTDPSFYKGDDLPVERITWNDAQEFCRRLNLRLGLSGNSTYRLPSEAEWEYAARAETTTPFAFGPTINAEIVNYYGSFPYGNAPVGVVRNRSVNVGSLGVANAWGLYDMLGSVWEWVEDDWHSSYNGAPVNGSAWVETPRGLGRVIRGGGWYGNAVDCRSAARFRSDPGFRYVFVGLRLVRTLSAEVSLPNRVPALTVPNAQGVIAGERLSFAVSAADPDPSQTLTLTASVAGGSLPEGATFTAIGGSGEFRWTPTVAQVGSYTISFTATDNGTPALSETQTVSITVTPGPVWTTLNFTTASVSENGTVTRLEGRSTRQFEVDLGEGVKLEMVEVPGGSFTMGSPASEAGRFSSEGPQREVNVNGFVIGKYEVTQAQWRALMGDDQSSFIGDNLPAERITWNDAQEFCRRLNVRLGLSGNSAYRLPSEAEWEYAARAGTTTPFAFGPTINAEIVNYDGRTPYGNAPAGIFRNRSVNVGSLGVANAWGLYDMHGNVWEWVEDDHHDSYNGAPVNGRAWVETPRGYYRVVRGGGWDSDPVYCRSANRSLGLDPSYRRDNVGFRLVRTLP